MYINSPGGSVTAGLAIYDAMQFIAPDVQTICYGIAMSMGSLLLAGGAKGKRMALPNSRILIHQPSGGFQGQSTDNSSTPSAAATLSAMPCLTKSSRSSGSAPDSSLTRSTSCA